MTKTLLLAGAAALAFSGTANAGAHPSKASTVSANSKHVFVLPHRNASVLYDQSAGSNGIAIVSQDFTDSSFPTAYDADGADDFVLPAGKHVISDVVANGTYFNGSGPAITYNVTFYKKIKKGKGKAVLTCTGNSYVDLGFGQPQITLGGCTGKNKFKGGKAVYVSVYAVMPFIGGGEWGWGTNNTVNGSGAYWRNPGSGFGTGCTGYTALLTCIPSGEGGDFAFAILGS